KNLAPLGDEALEELDVLPVDVLQLLRAELADLAPPHEELLTRPALRVLAGGAPAPGTSGSSAHSHDSLLSALSALSSAAGAASVGSAGGRGGRLIAFLRSLSVILAWRFNSSSTRTARWRSTWSDSPMRRSASATAAGSDCTCQ